MQSFQKDGYLKELAKRGAKKNISQNFQFIGLEGAMILRDLSHKSLYIKLAKEHGPDRILSLAKDVVDRRNVKNPAAYFMTLVKEIKK